MTFTALLQHFADFTRPTDVTDRFGQPQGATASVSNVPCRFSTQKGYANQEKITTASREVIHAPYTLFTEPGVNVRKDDIVTAVRDADGATIAQNLQVVAIKRVGAGVGVGHHIEIALVEIT